MQNGNLSQKIYNNVIIDVNNLYHKNYHVYKNMIFEVNNKHIVTGGVYGFIKSLKMLQRKFLVEGGCIYFLFDNPDSKQNMRQLSIDPTYKANRKKYSQPFYRSLDYLRLILMDYDDKNIVIYGTGFEADDLAPNVVNSIPNDEKTLIVSEDLDWARLLNYQGKHVDLYLKKSIFNRRKFNEKYNFMPTEDSVVLYKVIRGDESDNIPIGIPNMPSKIIEKLIGDYKDIFEIIDNLEIIPYLNKKWKDKIIENKSRLRLNYQLVSFIPISDNYLKQFTFESKFRPKNLLLLYKSLGFDPVEIDNRLENFIIDKNNVSCYNNKESQEDSFFKVPKPRRE